MTVFCRWQTEGSCGARPALCSTSSTRNPRFKEAGKFRTQTTQSKALARGETAAGTLRAVPFVLLEVGMCRIPAQGRESTAPHLKVTKT